jgi:hypothetical protein
LKELRDLEKLEEKKKRVVLIDNPNLSRIEGEVGIEGRINTIEFCKLLARDKEKDTHIFYYYRPTEITRAEGEENPFLGFLDFLHDRLWRELAKQGISLVVFPAIRNKEDAMIIQDISILMFEREWLLLKNEVEEIVLVSGDGGFSRILELVKEKKIRVKVVAGKERCARALREVADEICYIDDLLEKHPELILKNNSTP